MISIETIFDNAKTAKLTQQHNFCEISKQYNQIQIKYKTKTNNTTKLYRLAAKLSEQNFMQ